MILVWFAKSYLAQLLSRGSFWRKLPIPPKKTKVKLPQKSTRNIFSE